MQTVYFAHPISAYATPEERRIIANLQELGYKVVNPSEREHKEQVMAIKAAASDRETGSGAVMEYFYKLCDACDGCVILSFPNGTFGAGVVGEAERFLSTSSAKPVFEIKSSEPFILELISEIPQNRKMDVAETRAMLGRLVPGYARISAEAGQPDVK